MTISAIQSLRRSAISHSLFHPTTLRNAFDRLKFVQADPIRSPARAQDLILRHRVENYRAGDLEEQYPNLDLEEDVLYAYGFLTRDVWGWLHPRKMTELSEFEQKVRETVSRLGETHPKQLESHFGRERVVNAWGGYSKATTRALEKLHYCGQLRIVRRAGGIRIYGAASPFNENLSLSERLKKLIFAISNIFAPVTERCLQEALAPIRRSLPEMVNTRAVIAELLKSGELESQTVDGIRYLYPAGDLTVNKVPQTVRFLAPFDPLVWDRRRFEHFWGWAYRFEAYTPQAKRLRGYYALPLLWGERIIGWANVQFEKGALKINLGYVEKQPAELSFPLNWKRK
jgi:uncharacterized protein YcaQ